MQKVELGMKGKRSVVTGTGQGIGRETALVLAQEGAVVCVSDINDSRGKETVEEICERGGTGIYIHADVGVPEEIKHLFRTAAERLGSVDILINNAAISPKVPFEDIPHDVRSVLVCHQTVFVCFALQIAVHGKRADILAALALDPKLGADFHGNIPAVGFVYEIFERDDKLVRSVFSADAVVVVVDGDKAHA